MTIDPTVEERLSAAFAEPMTPQERAVLDTRITTLLEGAPAPRRRFRLRLTRSLLLVAALLILLPSIFVVSAAIWRVSTEAPYGMGDADAYEAELAAAKSVTPIPPGATWPPYLDGAEDRSASYATRLGQSIVEYNAYCLWLGYWYQAQEAGDAASVNTAVTALEQARDWETFSDPTKDQGFRDYSQRMIDAVERRDALTVLNELEVNCEGTWPPPSGK